MNDNINNILGVNLVDYAYKRGYVNKKNGKESSNWISLENPSTKDHIRIRTKPYPMVYNNNDPNLSNDRGNIINFTINRLENYINPENNPSKDQFAAAFEILKEEIGEVSIEKNFSKGKSLEDQINDTAQYVKTKINNLKNPNSNGSAEAYLNLRKINPDLLYHPLFFEKIKESPVPMTNGKIITNFCFVKTDLNNKISGLVSHYHSAKENTNIKRVYEQYDNIWKSNIIDKPKNLIYGESGIDCLSHFEIFNSKNCTYLSLEGEASLEKIGRTYKIYEHLNQLNNNETTLCSITDNDYNGHNYDLRIAIEFYNKKNFNNPIEINNEHNGIKYTIHGQLNKCNLSELKEKMLQIIKFEAPNHHQFFTPYLNLVQTKDYTIISVPYKIQNYKIYHFLKPLTEAIHLANDVKYFNHKSKKKDWNEELVEKKTKAYQMNLKNTPK